MTRRQRDHSKLVHIIISLLNHKLGATLSAAQAACQCLNFSPSFSALATYQNGGAGVDGKKKRVRKREISLYRSC